MEVSLFVMLHSISMALTLSVDMVFGDGALTGVAVGVNIDVDVTTRLAVSPHPSRADSRLSAG